MVFPKRDSDGESASFTGFAVNRDCAFVSIDNEFYYAQSEAATLGLASQ